MKWWAIPSWNGDLRLEPSGSKETLLSVVSPTEHEKKVLAAIVAEGVKRGWIEGLPEIRRRWWSRTKKLVLRAPMDVVGPVAVSLMRPGPAVLTAIKFSDGKLLTTSGGPAELAAVLAPYRDPEPPKAVETIHEGTVEVVEKPTAVPEVAATVKRPTPSCPRCVPGAVGPASDVLLSFLSPNEHEGWARSRSLVVQGGITGHRYLLVHRHMPLASKIGRICYDLDDDVVVHFHDWSVPPEEEVLAAKLILERREPWLRNEATFLGARSGTGWFKNPFGDLSDGIADAQFTQRIGRAAWALARTSSEDHRACRAP